MGHGSRYQRITWELTEPLEGVNNSFTMVGGWRTSAILSSTFIDVPTIKLTQQWIDQNAPDKFIITSQSGMLRFSNAQLASTPLLSSGQAIIELQKLLDLSKIPEPVIDIIPEIDLEPALIVQKPNNNLRNALLIGGALLIL